MCRTRPHTDPVTLGTTIRAQSWWPSCLASPEGPFPATLTLFLIRCGHMFCLDNAVSRCLCLSVSYINLIWGLSTPRSIYLARPRREPASIFIKHQPAQRKRRSEGLLYELLRLKSFSYYLSVTSSIPFLPFPSLFFF